jgi:cytochrome c-type biogenesis protein CcmH/NrfG
MAHIVETQVEAPGAELRRRLDRAERQLPALQAGDLAEYLCSLDRLQELMEALTAEDADLRPEMTRWLDLQARLGARSGQMVKLAAAEGGFAALRAAHPPAAGAWWRLDELVVAERKRNWTRLALTLAAIVLLLAVAAFVYQRWLAPSPEVVMVMSALNDVEQLVLEQQWDAAVAAVEAGLQATPGDPDLLIWAAALAERRGAADQAANYLAQAEEALGDPMQLQLILGMRRLQVGDLDGVEAAALAAQALDADEPQATFLLASAAEARGQMPEAMELFQRTAALAEARNDPQLTVVARMRYGMLLQQLPMSGATSPATADPAATSPATSPITATTPAP